MRGLPTWPSPACALEPGGVATVKRVTTVEPGSLRVPYTVLPSCWRSYSVPWITPSSPHRFGSLAASSSMCFAVHFEPGSGAVDRLTVPSRTQRYTVRACAAGTARAQSSKAAMARDAVMARILGSGAEPADVRFAGRRRI